MENKAKSNKKFIIVMGIVLQAACLFPWIWIGSRKYNSAMYLFHLLCSDNIGRRMKTDLSLIPGARIVTQNEATAIAIMFIIQLSLLVMVQVLSLLFLILALKKKERTILQAISMVLASMGVVVIIYGPAAYMGHILVYAYPAVILLLLAIEFLGQKLIDEWDEVSRLEQEKKVKEKEYKMERKRRLKFEGKYSASFYKVIWKNFRFRWRSYQILILVGAVSVGFVFAGIGLYEMLSPVHEGGNILTGRGLEAMLLNFLAVGVVVSTFLIVAVFLYYLRSNMGSYRILLNLGMRKKTLYLFMGIELAACFMLSLIGGGVMGNISLFAVKGFMGNIFGGAIEVGFITARTYLFTVVCTAALFSFALLLTHDAYLGSGDRALEKEKMPGKHRGLLFVSGIVLAAGSLFLFSKKEMAEEIWIIGIFLAGLYLLLRNGWGILLAAGRRRADTYYSRLLDKNYFYYRFKTAFRYIFFITVVHICVLFVFSRDLASSIIAQDTKELFPYDYVCLATEEDEEFFEELKSEYHADIAVYPMVRAVNVDNTAWLEDIKLPMQPQGQHIGISESTYRKLCRASGREAKELNLAKDGSEIYVIYQQDASVKAHPIDYFMDRSVPYIHIGQPVTSYDYIKRKEIFTGRKIVGEEIGMLTGAVRQGMHENIIVFSDEYYSKVQNDWKTTDLNTGAPVGEAIEDVTVHHWPTRLVLINTADEDKTALDQEMQTFKKRHAFDETFDGDVLSYYARDQVIRQVETERTMNIAVSAFIMFILFTAGAVMMCLKVESEMPDRERKHEFLKCMGMRRKERIRTIKSEMNIFLWLPLVAAAVVAPVFTGLMWKMRFYTSRNCTDYLWIMAVISLVYIAAQAVVVKGLEYHVVRKVEGKDGGNSKNP